MRRFIALFLLLSLMLLPTLSVQGADVRSFTLYLADYPAFLASPSPSLLQSGEMPSEGQLARMQGDWDALPFPLPRETDAFPDAKIQIVLRGDEITYQLRYMVGDLLIRFILPDAMPDESIAPIGDTALDGRAGMIYPGSEGSAYSVYFDGEHVVRVNFYAEPTPEALAPFVWANAPQTEAPASEPDTGPTASCRSRLSHALLPALLPIPLFSIKRRRMP